MERGFRRVVAEGGAGGGQVLWQVGCAVGGEVFWGWVGGWAGVVGLFPPDAEAVGGAGADPGSALAVVGEGGVDARHCPGEDGHVAY